MALPNTLNTVGDGHDISIHEYWYLKVILTLKLVVGPSQYSEHLWQQLLNGSKDLDGWMDGRLKEIQYISPIMTVTNLGRHLFLALMLN